MSQSLTCIKIHLIFSTKGRQRWIKDELREPLHRYMATVLHGLNCPAVVINSVEDHVHILFELARTVSISEVVEDVKKSSSKWIKSFGPDYLDFSWQGGYGAFAVSASNIEMVRAYVSDQQKRHRDVSFQDEFQSFLKKHQVKFDPKYVWD